MDKQLMLELLALIAGPVVIFYAGFWLGLRSGRRETEWEALSPEERGAAQTAAAYERARKGDGL